MGGLEGAHHDLIAYGQEGEVGAVELADELHIPEDAGVARVVPRSAGGLVGHPGAVHRAACVGTGRGPASCASRCLACW